MIGLLQIIGKRGLTIDRINNNLKYEPDNCRWTTMKVQSNNKRNNRLIRYGGKIQTVSQWADEIGISQSTLFARLYKGWSIEKILTTPLKRKLK